MLPLGEWRGASLFQLSNTFVFLPMKVKTELLICVWLKLSDIQCLLPSVLPLTCGDKLCYCITNPYVFHLCLACLGVVFVHCGVVTASCKHFMQSDNRLTFMFTLFCSACVSTVLK